MFKNATLFRFSTDAAHALSQLGDVAGDHLARECGALEMSTRGFVPPTGTGDDEPIVRRLDGTRFLFASMGGEDKILPAAAVTAAVSKRVRKIEREEGRKLGGKRRKMIKEEVINAMLPVALVKPVRVNAYADLASGWLVVDTASKKQAEDFVALIRVALGSFPALYAEPEASVTSMLTDWTRSSSPASGFRFGTDIVLTDGVSKWSGREVGIDSNVEVAEHLNAGEYVTRLGVVYADRISLALDADGVLRKLALTDDALESKGDHDDAASAFDVDAFLMVNELAPLLFRLDELLTISRPANK